MTEQVAPPPADGPSAPQQSGAPVPPPPGAPVPPGAPGGFPPPPAEGMGPAPAEGMGPAPKSGSVAGSIVKRLVILIVVAGVVFAGGLAWKYLKGDPDTASVGDCLAGQSEDDIKTVKCDDPSAQHKVVGKLDGKSESDFNASDNPCTAYPTAENAFWKGKKGGDGYILCLEPIKK